MLYILNMLRWKNTYNCGYISVYWT